MRKPGGRLALYNANQAKRQRRPFSKGTAMRISVKLGGPLRKRVQGHERGEMNLDLAAGARVSDALLALGLVGDVVRVLMVNGRPIKHDQEMQEGDRLALFPRELAFNTQVAVNFYNPLARQGGVQPRD